MLVTGNQILLVEVTSQNTYECNVDWCNIESVWIIRFNVFLALAQHLANKSFNIDSTLNSTVSPLEL
jgi:hypothetical protein